MIFIFSSQSVSYSVESSTFDSFYNLRIMIDAGTSYELRGEMTGAYADETIDYRETAYEAEDKGVGLAFQYSIGLGCFVSEKRPWFGIGFLTESHIIYSKESSIFSMGLGCEIKLFKYFNFCIGSAISLFSNELPDVKEFNHGEEPILKNESWNGESVFICFGINIPFTEFYDFVFQASMYEFGRNKHEGYWERVSVRLGIAYIH